MRACKKYWLIALNSLVSCALSSLMTFASPFIMNPFDGGEGEIAPIIATSCAIEIKIDCEIWLYVQRKINGHGCNHCQSPSIFEIGLEDGLHQGMTRRFVQTLETG
jgi:hypothetical protein